VFSSQCHSYEELQRFMGAKNKQIKNAPVVVLYGGCNAFTSILCSWMKHRLNNVNGLFMSSMLLKDQGVHESKHQDWSHVHERKKKRHSQSVRIAFFETSCGQGHGLETPCGSIAPMRQAPVTPPALSPRKEKNELD